MPMKLLESMLVESYADFKLTNEEKFDFKQKLSQYKQDASLLSFVRNRAFGLVAENYRSDQAKHALSLKWLENIVKSIDSCRDNTQVESSSYFSPSKRCANKIIALLERAKKSVDICVFTISDNNIANAIKAAHKRGVEVRIVSDNDKANDLGSDVYSIAEYGIATKIDQSPNHMHHKYAIFDQKYLVNGSFNWTRSASKYNQENIVVTNEQGLIGAFQKEFEKLWQECRPIS